MPIVPHPSPNFNDRALPLQYIVLHYTDHTNVARSFDVLCDPARAVSAHYLLDYDGTFYHMVDDAKRAWHAGKGSWQGVTDMNSASIGIEIENPGHSNGYIPFTEEQILAVIEICKMLVEKHGLNPRNVIGHSDLAPARKEDPGHLFPWDRLAAAGFGLWPAAPPVPQAMSDDDARQALEKIGYDVSDYAKTLIAFQRHFCVNEMGQGLTLVTGGWLRALV